MIRKISIAFILIIFNLPSAAQNFKPMLGDYSEWYIGRTYMGVSGRDFYTAEGDTIMDGKSYKFLNYYHFNKNFSIREDLDSGKVFLRVHDIPSQNRDYLVYDFSLNVGDSIEVANPAAPAPQEPGYYYVDSIRFIDFALDVRKVLYLSQRGSRDEGYNYTHWIEGIGSGSLINTPGSGPDPEGIGTLQCFYRDGEGIFIDNSDANFSPCESGLHTIKQIEAINNWSVFPVPAKEVLGIDLHYSKPVYVKIYDTLGNLMFSQNIEANIVNQLFIGNLASGLYLLNTDEPGFKTIRFIKE